MTTLLIIEASARANRSISRTLARTFEKAWLHADASAQIIRRDVGRQPPPYISESWIEAAFVDQSRRSEQQTECLAVSDQYIDEVERADVIVIATPMYNYGMPAALKAWFDQVIRVGKTFSFDLRRGDWPLRPMMADKTLVGLCAHGEFGFGAEGIRTEMNHLQPHITTCARYLGANQLHFVSVEYQEFGDERHHRSLTRAQSKIDGLVTELIANQPLGA